MSERQAASANEDPIVPSPAVRLTGRALGIDIGGTGIKAAVVDVASGQLVTDRIRELTPRPATPEAVLEVVVDVVRRLEATGELTADMPGGAGFPSVIRAGRTMTATNLDHSWIGAPVQELLRQRLGRPMVVLNDADAAGVAEIAYGTGKGQRGVVLLLDLGTGIGSALFVDGRLVPNMQLGHVEFHCRDAETRLSPAARTGGRSAGGSGAANSTGSWPDTRSTSGRSSSSSAGARPKSSRDTSGSSGRAPRSWWRRWATPPASSAPPGSAGMPPGRPEPPTVSGDHAAEGRHSTDVVNPPSPRRRLLLEEDGQPRALPGSGGHA